MLRSVLEVIVGVLVMRLVVAGIEFASHPLPVAVPVALAVAGMIAVVPHRAARMRTPGLLLPVPVALSVSRLGEPRLSLLEKAV